MPIFSQLMFLAVHWAARRGLREQESFSSDAKKAGSPRTGIRGETYAYWYLRKQGTSLWRGITHRGASRVNSILSVTMEHTSICRSENAHDPGRSVGTAGIERYSGKNNI